MSRLLLRVLLGAPFVLASLAKIAHPQLFASAVSAYQIVPLRAVPLISIVLPWLELLCGLGLILGFLTRSCALWLVVLSGLFGLAVSQAMWRGLDISCGCFGGFGGDLLGVGHILLNSVLAFTAAFILKKGPGRLAIDSWLWGPGQC